MHTGSLLKRSLGLLPAGGRAAAWGETGEPQHRRLDWFWVCCFNHLVLWRMRWTWDETRWIGPLSKKYTPYSPAQSLAERPRIDSNFLGLCQRKKHNPAPDSQQRSCGKSKPTMEEVRRMVTFVGRLLTDWEVAGRRLFCVGNQELITQVQVCMSILIVLHRRSVKFSIWMLYLSKKKKKKKIKNMIDPVDQKKVSLFWSWSPAKFPEPQKIAIVWEGRGMMLKFSDSATNHQTCR